ncbi:hypothetical protein AJ79_02674 [Helicocarpus griseus UAMH5409]|uniref:Aminoglycoside phosphotransferase domain-containing protein n=1 Tax=Helicocarpus griseus UAMH5409 TaxID=1447875 RepID=A0A2B7XTA5_9EURO|nr:hypothetical protein AJ79_02674 [Helicocarpus griseus UAMH5409]
MPFHRNIECCYLWEDRCHAKRSRNLQEFRQLCRNDKIHTVPPGFIMRLRNEADVMKFIQEATDIPVPDVFTTYSSEGCFRMRMETTPAVPMFYLPPDEQEIVKEEVEGVVKTLQGLRSNEMGGPTDDDGEDEEDYVFCHGELTQSNIYVDPDTLKIRSIYSWGYAGFYPKCFEFPFWQKVFDAGPQRTYFFNDPEHECVQEIMRFLSRRWTFLQSEIYT